MLSAQGDIFCQRVCFRSYMQDFTNWVYIFRLKRQHPAFNLVFYKTVSGWQALKLGKVALPFFAQTPELCIHPVSSHLDSFDIVAVIGKGFLSQELGILAVHPE